MMDWGIRRKYLIFPQFILPLTLCKKKIFERNISLLKIIVLLCTTTDDFRVIHLPEIVWNNLCWSVTFEEKIYNCQMAGYQKLEMSAS